MHDLKFIRDNPADFDAAMKRRGFEEAQSPAILRLDEDRRSVQTQLQDLQAARNAKSKEIGKVKAQGGDAQPIMDEVSAMKDRMGELEGQERDLGAALNDVLAALPNVMFADVPDGADEDDNVELRTWGEIDKPSGPDHVEIGERLGMMDFEAAAKVAGSRFVVNKGHIARLERALTQFMLDTHTQDHGYTEVIPPLLVTTDVMFGTGQLPKFQDDQFETTDGRWIIPTAEVVLTNLVREDITSCEELPLRLTASTPCFKRGRLCRTRYAGDVAPASILKGGDGKYYDAR